MTSWGLPQKFLERALQQETDECILWPYSVSHRGYPRMFTRSGNIVVTRVICTRIHGEAPSFHHEAAHSCHHSSCINKRHLSWQTHKQNANMSGHNTGKVIKQ